ncbi:TPR repeat protein [Cenarchaeum symbiosum A]|uniref:TPR repeat protein n=1 Tax=Cenarchaeum symbiosum (strain A) TaxID=414004 RepID=A0RYK7_CENSY|nr:TPR repeat protein [Cenarchaeum symbiosum A]
MDGGPHAEGMKLLEEGRFDEALELFEGALRESPDDPDLLNGKGVSLRSLGRYDEANECLARSLELDPRDRMSS